MSSRRIDSVALPAAEQHWRPLAQRAGYDLQTAAQLLGISVRQFERLCQRELGRTPSEWLDRERMADAARLLTEGQPVKIVALHLGYTQPGNFSRDFKRHFGRPPRAFVPRLWLPPQGWPGTDPTWPALPACSRRQMALRRLAWVRTVPAH